MSMADNFKSILDAQKYNISRLEREITSIENNDLVNENEYLKAELSKCKSSLEMEKSQGERLSKENKKLRDALYEQIYNEKIQILNAVNKRVDIYYRSGIQGEMNRLTRLEMTAKRRINDMAVFMGNNGIDIKDELYEKLRELGRLAEVRVKQAREALLAAGEGIKRDTAAEFAKLKQEQVAEEEIRDRIRKNNIESFIGLNIINKLGIFLLIIGVIAASQYTFFRLSDTMKCIFTFAIGIVLLAAGELLNRKKPNVFSLGITSGGIAVLYVALALGYFKFEIMDIYPSLGLCVLITAGAFLLSQRYDSQTITAFAMIGGYLPILSIAGSETMVYGAMIYFAILNILALMISVKRKWTITAFIGFSLNVLGTAYITDIMISGRNHSRSFSISDLITLLYMAFVFIIYTLVPVAGTFGKKLRFKNSDIVLLALNTFVSAYLIYAAFYGMYLSDFTGLLTVVFASVYLALGRFVGKYMAEEKKVKALFYITGLTFMVLVIPFQFGRVWLSLGWLVEGIALLCYGIYKGMKDFKKAGMVISLLCLAAFVFYDIPNYDSFLFFYKYLAITVGSIVALGFLVYKREHAKSGIRIFSYASIINIWIFSLYTIGDKLGGYLSKLMIESNISSRYLTYAAMIIMSFLIAYVIPRIKAITDNAIKGISTAIYITVLTAVFLLNFQSPMRGQFGGVPLTISIIGTIELLVLGILSVLALRDMMLRLVAGRKLGVEWYPFIISAYIVFVLTQNLVTQYNLGFNNALISIMYIVTAFAWITFGFIKRYVFIRRFGLGLSITAVAKLFIIDLAFLDKGYRIISYFVFGLILLAISYVYQYFIKRIDNIEEVMPDDKKTVD